MEGGIGDLALDECGGADVAIGQAAVFDSGVRDDAVG